MNAPWCLDEVPQRPRTESPAALPTSPDIDEEEVEEEQTGDDSLELFDTGAIVEEAELLLRESAPHDYDMLVIGAGTGGCATALRAAELGARVGLIEARHCGGAYLNRGSVALHTMLSAVNLGRELKESFMDGFGRLPGFDVDFPALMARAQLAAKQLREELVDRLLRANITLIAGSARFVTEHVLEITGLDGTVHQLSAVQIVIATGSTVGLPEVSGAHLPGVITADEIHELEVVPRRCLVAGSDPRGFEIAYLLNELGNDVTFLESAERIIAHEEPEIGNELYRLLDIYGVDVEVNAKVTGITRRDDRLAADVSIRGRPEKIPVDCVILTDRHRPNIEALRLERAGIVQNDARIVVDSHGETSVAGVYAVGSCTRVGSSAHRSSGEGTAVAEIICGRRPTIDLLHAPNCYYTYPEIASIGLTEKAAEAEGFAVRSHLYRLMENDVAKLSGQRDGFVKLVWEEETRKLLGCHIVGPRATEVVHHAAVCLRTGQTLKDMGRTLCARPTYSEALTAAARAAIRHG